MKVILGKAVASSKNEQYPSGEIHAVLMFVKSDNNNKAQKTAKIKIQKKGWETVNMSRIGAVNLDNFKPENDEIEKAFNSAIENGFGLLIYPDIESNLNL